jgi:hypothetical protein
MSALIVGSNRIQSDLAGFTSRRAPPSVAEGAPAAPTPTEVGSGLLHGESGSLGHLFDSWLVVPVSTELERTGPQITGPNGGQLMAPWQPASSAARSYAGTAAQVTERDVGTLGSRAAAAGQQAQTAARSFGQRIGTLASTLANLGRGGGAGTGAT